jgi:uncharacterized membrane protein
VEGLTQLLGMMKMPLRYFVGLAAALGFVLLAPATIISRFGLLKYREEGKLYLGLSLILLGAIITSQVIGWIAQTCKNHFRLGAMKKRLNILTTEEKNILREYIEGQTRTVNLSIQSGVVNGLEHDKIIYRSANVSSFFTNFAYNIQPWAWNYLNQHRDLLGLD